MAIDTDQRLIDADIAASNLEAQNASLAMQEFILAARYFQWERARDAQDRVTAHIEAQMDAFTRATQRMEKLSRGSR